MARASPPAPLSPSCPPRPTSRAAAGPRAGHLLHLLPADDWAAAPDEGELRPASLAEQGFVHLSTAEQVALPATRQIGRAHV